MISSLNAGLPPEARLRANPELLLVDLNRPSAACALDEDIVERTLIEVCETGNNDQVDLSFTRQIATLTEAPQTLHPHAEAPEAILFTAYSAIPFVNLFEGYYEAAGLETPEFSFIKASRREVWNTPEVIEEEVERLTPILAGANHVCVVDEHVSTGRSLQKAHNILKRINIPHLTAVRGIWDPYGVDVSTVYQRPNSYMEYQRQQKHTSVLYMLGQVAAELKQ